TLAGSPGRENILGQAFGGLGARYDYIIVDCPPNVGLLTFNALKACSEALVPMDPSFFALHGIGKLLETFDVLARMAEHRVDARVLITLYPGRALFVKAVVEEIRRHLGGQVFETVVRYSVKLGEAASHGLPIVHYCRRSTGLDQYQTLRARGLRQEWERRGVRADVGAAALRAMGQRSALVPDGIAAD